jgi:hypothetical protein
MELVAYKSLPSLYQRRTAGSCTITVDGLATYFVTWLHGTRMVVAELSQPIVLFTGNHLHISYLWKTPDPLIRFGSLRSRLKPQSAAAAVVLAR